MIERSKFIRLDKTIDNTKYPNYIIQKYDSATKPVIKKKIPLCGSFKIEILIEVLRVLGEYGKTKRTNLAGKTGLNYKQCLRYVRLLMLFGWVCIVNEEGQHVAITEKGIEIIRLFY